jgi:S1-C subfamily serine protease
MKLAMALMLCWLACCCAAAHAEVDPAVAEAETARVAVVAKASDSTLAIFAGEQGGGSGVVISPDGFALTNFHVTSGAGNWMRCGMTDGRLYDAVIVGIDPVGDVALIKLLGRDDFPIAELADSDQVRVGDWCFSIGNPFLLATDFQPSVSFGLVSGVHRYQYPSGTLLEYADCIQTDAAINPGNSGGPLFDAQGRLIGINGRGSFEKRGRVNVGVGYAISINQIKHFLGHLKSGRIIDHATLGARVATEDDGRVLVNDVLETSDAYRRGLRYDDQIVRFAGRPIHTANAFKNALGIFPRNWRVPLTYQREGKQYDVLVRLSGVHQPSELLAKVQRQPPEPPQIPKPQPDEPDGDPKKKKEPGKDQDQPERGRRVPQGPRRAAKAEMPEQVKDHFEARPGYINYYFNRLAQQRLWKGLTGDADFASASGKWTLAGEIEGGGKVRFELSDDRALMALPTGDSVIPVDDDLTDALDPPQSGGLLAALSLWRRLLVEGLDDYGEVYYLGTLPLAPDGSAEKMSLDDVLVGLHAGVECRFFHAPDTGRLTAVEMWSDDQADPCEVYFSDYVETNGRWMPSRMRVRYGDGMYGVFSFKEISLTGAAEVTQ